MRSLFSLLAVTFALAAFPTAALADTVSASGASTAGGYRWAFTADYDPATNTLNLDCSLVSSDTGQPVAPSPTIIATVSVTQANNQVRTLDCVPLMNLGLQTSKVNLKIDTIGRWSGFYIQTSFRP